MRRTTEASDELDPPTEAMDVLEGITTAGGQATLSLQHLHSLLTTLAPLRAAYANAAVDRLRGLPTDSRRALLPHVLHEHPDLANEPRVRVPARDLGIDADVPDVRRWLADLVGVESGGAREALGRIERALLFFVDALASIAPTRPATNDVPEAPSDLLAWTLESDDARHERALHAWISATAAAREANEIALEVARERDAEHDLVAIEHRANVPRWWPSPFREAACWAQAKKERAARASFDDALAARLRTRREQG